MADGRRIPYIIELGVQDESLRKQMAKWNWEEIIGVKDLGKHFEKPAKEAGNAIENAFANTTIDWDKALQTDTFKKAVTKIVQHANAELREGLLGKDDAKNVTEFIGEIGNAWKEVGVSMDTKEFARSIAAFASSVESLVGDVNKLKDAFSKVFDKIQDQKNSTIAPNFQFANVSKEIDEVQRKIDKLNDTTTKTSIKITSTSNAKEVYGEVERILKNISATKEKIDGLQYDIDDPDISREEEKKFLLEQSKELEKLGNLYRQLDKVKQVKPQKATEAMVSLGERIDPKHELDNVISKLTSIKTILLETSSVGEGQTQQIGVSIALPTTEDVRKRLNSIIDQLNKPNSLHKVKLDIDDVANVIEDKTTRAYGNNPADDDANTSDLVEKTDKRFIQIAKTIGKKQKGILNNTKKWRSEMLKAMQFGRDELNFQFSGKGIQESADSLFNQLQEYFEQPEYALDIKFNTEKIARDLKASLEAEGIELGVGGGTANINAKSLASAFESALASVFLGKTPTSTTTKTSGSSTTKEVADKTDEATASGKEYVKVLDETTIHIDKVIASLQEFAKEATKSKASKGSKAIAGSLTHMGIDIGAIKNGASDTDIITMLQNALMSKDEMGKAQGASLVGTLEGMIKTNSMDPKKGAGKVADALAKDIMELFNINELETELETELIRRFEQLEIWRGIEKPGKALAALGNVRSTKKKIKTPAMEQIDEAIKYFETAEEDTAPLQKLKEARKKFEDSGETDEAKKEFEKAASVFYDETKTVFTRLKDRWGDFKGVVQAEGRRPVNIDPKGAYPTRILEIPDGAVISKVDIFEVFKTIRDVGFEGSTPRKESSQRKAESEQQRLIRGSQTPNFIVKKPTPKKDVRYEDIEYDTFKTQESGRLPKDVALDATIASLEKRAEEIPELVKRIEESKKKITEFEDTKQRIKNEIDNLKVQDLPEFQMNAFEQYSKRDSSIKQVLKNANDALSQNDILDAGDISKLDNEQRSLVDRLNAITTNIHNDSVASQEFADKIEEIVEAKKLSREELEIARSNAAQSGEKARVDLYSDLLFDKAAVDNRLELYQSKKGSFDENIGKSKNYAQKLIDELKTSGGQSTDRATKEAEALAAQLIEVKERLYAEAKTYADILNNSNTDDKTREVTVGKLQETLKSLDQITGKFAQVQPYALNTSLYNSSQQKNVDKWNKNYTNKEVNKLEKELKALENQLKEEDDESKVAELKKKIANTKRNLTRLKKSVLSNVSTRKTNNEIQKLEKEISSLESQLENEQDQTKIEKLKEKIADTKTQLDLRKETSISSRKQSELTNIERKLGKEQSKLTTDENQKRAADKDASDLKSTKQDVAFLTKYNELLGKEKTLLEEVEKLKEEGADKSVIEGKTEELKQATKALDDFLKKEKTAERTSYAREAAVEYQAQLQTAYRKKSVFDSQIQGLDDDAENLTKYGLSGRVGSRARRRALNKATSEYMSSDDVRAQEEAIRQNEQLSWEQRNKQLEELRRKLREEFQAKFDDTNVVQDELDRIATEKAIAEAGRKPLDDIIKDLQSQKKASMRYGDVHDDDLKNDKYLKQNEEYNNLIEGNLKKLQKKQKELEDVQSDDKLTEKDQEKKVKAIQKEIDAIEQENQRYQILIDNRVKLMELHKKEKEESKQTPEEKALLATEKLVGLKQSLAKTEEKVAVSKAEYESAKGTENEVKMLEALDNQIKKRDQIQEQISDTEKKIERLGQVTRKTEVAKEEVASTIEETVSSEVSGGLLGLIKEAVGETSVGNIDLIKVEEILSKILAILSGNGAIGSTRNAEMDAKLARIKELEAKQQLANEQKKTAETKQQVENAKKETAVSPNVANSKAHKNVSKTQVYKDVQKSVDAFRISELSADKEPLNAIKLALDGLSKINDKNSQEYIEWQRKLGSALAAYGKKNGIENGRGYYDKIYADLEKNGIAIDSKLPITNKSGVSNALVEKGLVAIKEKEAKAKQSEANAEEKITEEKKEQEKIRFTRKEKKELNRLKSETKDYNPDATASASSEFGGLATENTLRAILEVLGKISTNGVPKSGSKSSGTGTKQNDSEQDDNEMTELERRVGALKGKFADAISVGYLDKNNEDLAAFNKQLDDIANSDGTVEQLEEMRKKALALGDVVSKTVAKNKRLYSGTTEINAATRQHSNMEARGVLDYADLGMVKEYSKAYDELIAKHKEFAVAGTLYDPNNQKTLQNMAIKVKDLGKQLEKSVTEAEQLQQMVDNSGSYNGKKMGGVQQLSIDETKNLETSMKSYLQSLNLGNLEHVKFDHTHQKLNATLRTSNKTVADLEVKYNEVTGALYAYQKAERESLTGVPAFISGFKKKFNSIMQYLSMTMSIHQVIAELRKGIQYVREIDLALTELKKVTDETEETYDKFLKTAAKTGARLGTTISAVTEATATFAKLGYTMEQATEMAEAAIVYKNVGDNIESTEDAADSIISTMKGFKLEATESMRIVDSFNEVGNRFAITSRGIGEALRLSASALSEGGNSLDESIALITAANEVVNDPSSVGTALKTLTLRLRGSKTELEEMGEDVSDMATTTSSLQAKLLALTGGQVDIMLDENTFKNSTQILREMADAWEDMTDIQRAELCPYVQKCA